MSLVRLMAVRPVLLAWMLVVTMAGVVLALELRRGAPPLPTVASAGMPVPRSALDRTWTIGAKPGVTIGAGTRLEIDSRYGQFRGHWWWNRGWVYVSGNVLPGTRIHVHIDSRSLTISDIPGLHAISQIHHFGPYGYADWVAFGVVRFGISGTLIANRTTGGPFSGRHVADQLEGRAWTERGLTITRVHIMSTPANRPPCVLTQPMAGWDLGCPMFGERPLVSDRRGRFSNLPPDSLVDVHAISLTATPTERTQLPTDSLRVQW